VENETKRETDTKVGEVLGSEANALDTKFMAQALS